MKFKSIRNQLIFTTCIIFLVMTIVVSSISAYATYTSTYNTLETTMIQSASLAAKIIEKQFSVFNGLVGELAMSEVLTNPATSRQEKIAFLNSKTTQYSSTYDCLVEYVAADGVATTTGHNISQRDYFIRGMRGETVMSEPLMRMDNNKLGFTYARPVKNGNQILGVIFMVFDYDIIYQIIRESMIGSSGSAYVINNVGDTIIYSDQQMVIDRYNTAKEAQKDPSLARLGAIETAAIHSGPSFGAYSYGGEERSLAHAPINGSDGWTLLLSINPNEFMGGLVTSISLSVFACLSIAILSVVSMAVLATNMTRPISSIAKRMDLLAQGNLSEDVISVNGRNEAAMLANSAATTVKTMRAIISDISHTLAQIASGNLNLSVESQAYVGDFSPIQQSMNQIIQSLNNTMGQINEASEQVSSGSNQVSGGAQALSQGATEQAASIEELAATIASISEQVKTNALSAQNASDKATTTQAELMHSNEQMREMMNAMDEISVSSNQIGKIIKTIEDIAFQTNILALNAAVEAARAGAAGKGFAVVADEVRNLASKSAEASKNTSALIESSLKAVGNGTKIADETAKSLLMVVDGAREMAENINNISTASIEQADSIAQVTQGVDQIASVVHTNSATAEESAAASEELSGQAQMLRDLVGQFALKPFSGYSAIPETAKTFAQPTQPTHQYTTNKY